MTTLLLAVLMTIAGIALGMETWLLLHLRRQSSAIEQRFDAIERRHRIQQSGEPRRDRDAVLFMAGLPARSILNDFELSNLRGGKMTFSQWRGQRVAVVFVQPDCPFSRRLIAGLERSVVDVSSPRPRLIFVSTGESETNRALFAGVPEEVPVLLQEELELSRVWRLGSTPSAYIVDAAGVTEGEILEGYDKILLALGIEPDDLGETANGASRTTPLLPDWSALPRRLSVGDKAPDIELTLLTGDRVRFDSGAVRRTLVVFSDPACAPCRSLAPELQERHRQLSDDLRLVMISRGNESVTRWFASRHGLSFSISAQETGRIGRAFGMVETPSAVLLAPDGTVADPPVVGERAILALIDAEMAEQHVSLAPGRA